MYELPPFVVQASLPQPTVITAPAKPTGPLATQTAHEVEVSDHGSDEQEHHQQGRPPATQRNVSAHAP
jgi:hypothetical protein